MCYIQERSWKFKDRLTGDAHVAMRNFVVVVKTHMPATSLNRIPSSMKKISLEIATELISSKERTEYLADSDGHQRQGRRE